MNNSTEAIDPADLRTIEGLAAEHPDLLTVHALRYQVRRRGTNGLAPACVRLGRRILVSKTRYAVWLGTQAGQTVARMVP